MTQGVQFSFLLTGNELLSSANKANTLATDAVSPTAASKDDPVLVEQAALFQKLLASEQDVKPIRQGQNIAAPIPPNQATPVVTTSKSSVAVVANESTSALLAAASVTASDVTVTSSGHAHDPLPHHGMSTSLSAHQHDDTLLELSDDEEGGAVNRHELSRSNDIVDKWLGLIKRAEDTREQLQHAAKHVLASTQAQAVLPATTEPSESAGLSRVSDDSEAMSAKVPFGTGVQGDDSNMTLTTRSAVMNADSEVEHNEILPITARLTVEQNAAAEPQARDSIVLKGVIPHRVLADTTSSDEHREAAALIKQTGLTASSEGTRQSSVMPLPNADADVGEPQIRNAIPAPRNGDIETSNPEKLDVVKLTESQQVALQTERATLMSPVQNGAKRDPNSAPDYEGTPVTSPISITPANNATPGVDTLVPKVVSRNTAEAVPVSADKLAAQRATDKDTTTAADDTGDKAVSVVATDNPPGIQMVTPAAQIADSEGVKMNPLGTAAPASSVMSPAATAVVSVANASQNSQTSASVDLKAEQKVTVAKANVNAADRRIDTATAAETSTDNRTVMVNRLDVSVAATVTAPTLAQSGVATESVSQTLARAENAATAMEQGQRTAAVVAATPSLATKLKQINLQQQDAAYQLRERVQIMVRQNIQVAEVRLDPAELGQMQIRVNLQQEQASVQFIVQQQQTKELVEQQMPRLRELLQQQGIQLGEGQVQQQQQQQRDDRTAAEQHTAGRGHQGDDHLEGESVGTTTIEVNTSDRLVDYYA